MPRVPRGRHVSYPDRTPAARELPSVTCLDNIPEFLGGRHFSYTVHGTPLSAWDWACCDVFCTPEEVAGADCYKLPDCYTLGPGPGISKRVALYVSDAADCWSARGLIETLTYDAADDKWKGSVTLRAGTIGLEFECVDGLPDNDPEKFKLTLTAACLPTNPTVLRAGYQCGDPLLIPFPQVVVGDCCQCNGDALDPPSTTDPAQVQFFVAANCRPPRDGRHEWYKVEGATVTPVAAHARNCQWDQGDDYTCSNMRCPLVATVANVSGCACMAGTYDVDYITDQWLYSDGWPGCSLPGEIQVVCADNGDGTVTLTVTVNCGADNTGTAQITIPAADLEDLDETVEIAMSGGQVCTGTCLYQWAEMPMTWTYISDTCSATCDACPMDPGLPPGSFDGEQQTIPCAGGSTACCQGTISVRLMRAA